MKKPRKNKRVLLRLSVPRLNVRGPIAFEQVLASLHGLLSKEAKSDGIETISFEIAKIMGRIYFYISIPSHLKTLIASQIYSQYPEVEIEESAEYFTKRLVKNKEVLVATLRPQEPWVFPFKRHPQFEDKFNQRMEDPLGPITSALAQLNAVDDAAIIQFVVTPVSPAWNSIAQKTLRRFFGSGPWQWDWFRALYQWARLSPDKKIRTRRAPIWATLLVFFGWGGLKSLASIDSGGGDDDDQLDREEQTSGRHERETIFSASYDKISRLGFATNIRAIYIHSDPDELHAQAKIREIAGTFQQFSMPRMNHFGISTLAHSLSAEVFQRVAKREQKDPFILSQEEVATVFHLPTETVSTPAIGWVDSVKLEPPVDLPRNNEKGITLMGKTNFRSQKSEYGLREDDRRRHVYIIGKTGMGKSTLLENMLFSDIQAGKGVAVIDPHGDLADAVLSFVPKNRTNDVILFDPADTAFPVAFNLLEGQNPEHRALVASGLVNVFKKLYAESWGPRLEHFLRNTILALVEAPDTTMLGIPRMLVDKAYRKKILHFVKDPMVQNFWRTEFDALPPAKLAEAVGPIQNKVGQFLSSPSIRNILGQPKSSLDMRFAMDSGKIVIINLSKGKLGEDNSAMLGSLLITKFQLDAMSRADQAEKDRKDFYLYVDEFQNFATDSFATILSEARKYKLNLTMANQYIDQMSDEVRSAVFGNVGSLVSFQVGIDDAKVLSEQLDEERVLPIHLATLPKYQIYNRIMVDGMTTPVFSGDTIPPPALVLAEGGTLEQRVEKIRNFSRQRYAKPQKMVEDKILRWSREEEIKRPEKPAAPQPKNQNKPQSNESKPKVATEKPPVQKENVVNKTASTPKSDKENKNKPKK